MFEVDDDVLDTTGSHEHIVRLSGTGGEVWRSPSERFHIAWSTDAFSSVVGRTLLVTNEKWTAARGIALESGRVTYTLGGDHLWLWRNRWLMLGGGHLILADVETGGTLETRLPLPAAPSETGLVRIDGDVMLYRSEEKTHVEAYDLSREERLWSRPLYREIADRYGCDAGTLTLRPMEPNVFLAHVPSQIVVGCSLVDGSILWGMTVPYRAPVVPHRGRVYVMQAAESPSSPPRLACFEAASGIQIYDVPQPDLNAMDIADYGRPFEDQIAFGTRGGFLGLFELAHGGLVWSYRYTVRDRTNVPVHTPLIVADRLYAAADDGNLLIFEAGE